MSTSIHFGCFSFSLMALMKTEVEGNHGFTSHFDMSGFTCVLALLFDWFIASILYVINT